MKKIILLSLTVIMLGCGSQSTEDKLRQLEAKRDQLETQIDELRQQLAAQSDQSAAAALTPVTLQQITPEPFQHIIKVQGTVESDNNILIPAQSSGLVKKIHVSVGESVTKDQLLAELDGAILENALAELEINLELAQSVYERQSRLWQKEIGSEVQYLQAKTNKDALEKRLAATREQYELTKIKSPIDGTVDEILLKEGEAIGAGFGTIRVVKLSELKVTAHVSEEYVGQIKVGESVHVHLPVLNQSFSSTIRSVSKVIDPQNRTFLIEAMLPSLNAAIQPNSFAVLWVTNYKNPQALVVPVDVIQRTENQQFLYVAQTSGATADSLWSVRKTVVQTGYRSENRIEIVNGLTENDYIVVRGFHDLADGERVTVSHEE
jgi:RND family efflux transporter MFP subunit